jgi:hypothetical protein
LPLLKPHEANRNEILNKKAENKILQDQILNLVVDGKEETDNEDDEEELDEDDNQDEEEQEDDIDEDYIEEIIIPRGWKTGVSKCKRKYYYNDYNKDKWYLNYDTNGKHYFYNADNQSVWELPVLFHESDEKREEDKDKGFRQNFDEDLPTFKHLVTRLSMRQPGKEENSKRLNNENKVAGGAIASIFPKLPTQFGKTFEQVIIGLEFVKI